MPFPSGLLWLPIFASCLTYQRIIHAQECVFHRKSATRRYARPGRALSQTGRLAASLASGSRRCSGHRSSSVRRRNAAPPWLKSDRRIFFLTSATDG